jgi:hypothetical protein
MTNGARFAGIARSSSLSQPDCCGSAFPAGNTIPASPFLRQAAGPAFFFEGAHFNEDGAEVDVFPPNRVVDLAVSRAVEDSLYVQLEWTAPGGDLTNGKGRSTISHNSS